MADCQDRARLVVVGMAMPACAPFEGLPQLPVSAERPACQQPRRPGFCVPSRSSAVGRPAIASAGSAVVPESHLPGAPPGEIYTCFG